MPVPLNCRPDELFGIETNTDFRWRPLSRSAVLARVAARYVPGDPGPMERLTKPSATSELFRVVLPYGARLILRSVEAQAAPAMEQQCAIAAAVDFAAIVKPLGTLEDGGHCVIDDGRAWMAYRELPGDLFTGAACPVEYVIAQAGDLAQALVTLHSRLPAEATSRLPVAVHNPERWTALYADLCGTQASAAASALRSSLTPLSQRLLLDNRDALLAWVHELAARPRSGVQLVHNDLHHANVLVHEGRPSFLDLEDLGFESAGIAAAHSAFKLLRHTVHSRVYAAGDVRARIAPPLMERLSGAQAVLHDGAYRIVSDIWEIAEGALSRGERQHLYDLDKRIHNLFELHYLLS
jgi:aminoglycoside phosphotransferase (APT) family kinase protein